MSEEKQTVSGAYANMRAHESLCAERYKNIHGRLDLIFKVIFAAATVAMAAGGWAFGQVWAAQQQQMAALQQVVGHLDQRQALRDAQHP